MTSIGVRGGEDAISAYLIKNSKGEWVGGKKKREKEKGHSHKQSERLGGVLWVCN